jgi:hypothetical protein
VSAWTLNHIVAICQDCDWSKEKHGNEPWDDVVSAARHHATSRQHYVQVERGQHAHYNHRPDLEPVPGGET